MLGGPAQANYAAANVFLDALAERRRSEGLCATSIAWGLWQREGGMISQLEEADLARMRRSGIEPLSDEEGLALLDKAIEADRGLSLAAHLNPAGLSGMAAVGALPPILSGLVKTPRPTSAVSGSLAARLATLAEAEREDFVIELVRGEVGAVLGYEAVEAVDPEKAFKEMGFDSLAAVELRNRLGAVTGVGLATTTVFDYPTVRRLAEHLLAQATVGGAAKQVAFRAQASDEPIAIVGMACRYPGGVGSPEELWQLVAEGKDAITGFPTDRGWDLERLYDPDPDHAGTSYAREGGFVASATDFDAEFFSISPREALAMDPQQRLLLESCWKALEDAGIDAGFAARRAGGCLCRGRLPGTLRHSGDRDPRAGGLSRHPRRRQRRLGSRLLCARPRGTGDQRSTRPVRPLSSRCTSPASAARGECSLALAGGVTMLSTPGTFVAFSRQRGAFARRPCKSFADAADGTGWSEGVGDLVLERLSDAQRETATRCWRWSRVPR